MSDKTQKRPPVRTFSYRAMIIGIFSMLIMAMWVHYHEVLTPRHSILAENSPPASAVGIFVGVLGMVGLIAWLRPRLRLTAGELVVIYTMLVTSAPLMSQGMWHRFLGFVVAIPHNNHNLVLSDSFSDKLWPHGQHLVADRRFAEGLGNGRTVTPSASVDQIDVPASPIGKTTALELKGSPMASTADAPGGVILELHIPRHLDGRQILVPGERYYFNALFRLREMSSVSRLIVELQSDGGETVQLLNLRGNTDTAFSSPGAFVRHGRPYVSVPRDLNDGIDLLFRLEGEGQVAITDVTFFNNESVAQLHKGTREVKERDLDKLALSGRDALLVRPDSLATPRGIWYVLKGYVPWKQWMGPLAYWLSIILAVFFCLFGIGIVLRRQWADNERFSFPMVVIPRLLIEQRDEDGRLIHPLFRKRMFQVGVGLAFLYCLMQGLAYHVPGMPDPTVQVSLADYFSSPAIKVFINGLNSHWFEIIWLFVAIAFFVDLDMLLSILLFAWICKIPYFLGEVYGWKTMKGPLDAFPFPYEQHIGAFLGLAVMVLWVSRKHLHGVWCRILNREGGVDDRGEACSYRAAVGLILLGFLFFAVWGKLTGFGAGSSLLFFGFLVVCGLSASRIRTECGAPGTYFTPYFPYLIFYLLGGLFVFGTKTMVLAYCVGGFMAVAQFLMFAPSQVEMLHLGNHYRASPRGVGWALIFGVLGGILLGGYVMLVWAYGVGGENIQFMKEWAIRQDWYLVNLREAVARADTLSLSAGVAGGVAEATYPVAPISAVGVGAGITLLLAFLRAHFVGFWLHPIGYVLANTFFIGMVWGSLFTACVIKYVALKIGGPRLIREHLTPMFAGVFCGCILGMFFWDVVGIIAMANGATDVFARTP